MKRPLLLVLALPVVIVSCGDTTQQAALSNNSDTVMAAAVVVAEPEIHTDLYGTYSGAFQSADYAPGDYDEGKYSPLDDNAPMSLFITRITSEKAEGRTVVKGKMRPFSGKMTAVNERYRFVVDEPGDDKTDGRFDFTLTGDSLKGTWEAFQASAVKRPHKEYMLRRQVFVYNPNLMLDREDFSVVDYEGVQSKTEIEKYEDGTADTFTSEYYRMASPEIFTLNASAQELSEKQLKNLRKLDLEILRNTIFARHGFSFGKKSVRQFFEPVRWYVPVSNNVDAELTALERKNISLLQRFEKYAEDHYDTFGR